MIEIGPFTAGELPGQLTYPFTDNAGAAINITGYTIKVHYKRHGGTAVTRDGVVVTGASGLAGWTPIAADLATAGVYKLQWSATNGTNTYYAPTADGWFVYRVMEALGAAT